MAAPTLNHIGTFNAADTSSPVTYASLTMPGSVSNGILVVLIASEDTGSVTVTGVTHGSDALTEAIAGAASYQRCWIYYRVAPTPQTADLSVAFSGATLGRWIIGVYYLENAAQDAPNAVGKYENIGTSGEITVTITTDTSECMMLGIWNADDQTYSWTPSSGTTEQEEIQAMSMAVSVNSKEATTAGSNSFASSEAAASRIVACGVAIAPSSASAGFQPAWAFNATQVAV